MKKIIQTILVATLFFSNSLHAFAVGPYGTRTDYSVGSLPEGVVVDPVTRSIWVSNAGANTVSKLGVDGILIATYPVGGNPNSGVFDPVTNSVWVANRTSNTLSKINIYDGTRVDYPTGGSPYSVTFDSMTNSAWAPGFSGSTINKTNIFTGSRSSWSISSSAIHPRGVAFDPVTGSVWIASASTTGGSRILHKCNINTGSCTNYVLGLTNGLYPVDVVFDNITNSIWVTSTISTSPTVSKVNILNGAVLATYSVGTNPFSITFDPISQSVWTGNMGANTVSQVNIFTGARVDYAVGTQPWDIAFDNITNSIWVADVGSNKVTRLWSGVVGGTVAVASNISSSWTITGPATITGSGTSQSSALQPVGTYTITWNSVAGYTAPAPQSLTLTSGGTINFSGTYSVVPTGTWTAPACVTSCGTSYSQPYSCTGGNGICSGSAPATIWCARPACNTAPNAPTISGPTTAIVNNAGTYSFLATDPDSNQIRYGIDWNMDGTADEWLPAGVSYVNSDTAQSTTHSWSTTGTKTFQALAQDTPGTNSAWTSYTVTVSNPLPCDIAHVTSWGPCTSSATCTQPPAQLTGQPGTHVGTCPSPAYTGTAVDTCSTATITCTVPATACGNNICETGETFGNCPHDCRGRVQQF